MITYRNASCSPAAFQRVFGCSVEEFDALYAEFSAAYEERTARSVLTRKGATPRKRKAGAGRRFKHSLCDRLLLALFWLQVYPTLGLLGDFFTLDKTSAEDNLKDVLATLSILPSFTLEPPVGRQKKLHTWEQVLNAFPELALIADAALKPEQEAQKPKQTPPQNDVQHAEVSAAHEPEVLKPPDPSHPS